MSTVKLEKGAKAPANKAAGASTEDASDKPTSPCGVGFRPDSGVTATPAAPLNPRVLPSVSGSELLWPDVRPGIELDKLPEDCMTKLDYQCMEDANFEMKDMERIHEILCDFDIQFMSNSDRERIRKIIPEIERKLTQLKGRL